MALGTSRGRESEREMQDGTTDRMRMAFVLEDWDCVPMEVKRLAVFYCTHQLDTLADIAFFFVSCNDACVVLGAKEGYMIDGTHSVFNIHANQKLFIDARGFRSLGFSIPFS
jgi:hypothetical protein